jgi:hypothetical protein
MPTTQVMARSGKRAGGASDKRLVILIFRQGLISYVAHSLTISGYPVLFKFNPFLFSG